MNDDTDLNLPLRTEILKIALDLEYSINNLLLTLLSIENPNKKAFSNKSGNLSFKNKIDLLFDLDILKSDEHEKFLLVMEYRNQFLHNYACRTFADAVTLLGVDKRKRLLKFCTEKELTDQEYLYNHAFGNLYKKCLNILIEKSQDRQTQIKERCDFLNQPFKHQIYITDRFFDLADNILKTCEEHAQEILQGVKSDLDLLDKIGNVINEDINGMLVSEEFIQIQDEFERVCKPERIKQLYKR